MESSDRRASVVNLVLAVVVIAVIAFAVKAWVGYKSVESEPSEEIAAETLETAYEYRGQEGRTAFAILQEQHSVEFDETEFGPFVKSIDNVAAPETHYWAFYVNGEPAALGADSYVTKDDDLLRWQLDALIGNTE